ncbi:sulfatase [Mesorhizobium loti]|nr:sulfatase [Mesorhizobium loti]
MQLPNILFIVADDLNSWIAPLGRHPNVKTPAIDRLASRGTTFLRAYCTAPYCNASRMSVFTGCLPTTTGVYQNEPFWEAPLRRVTLLERLREAGYFCFGAGKVFHGSFDYADAGRNKALSAKWSDIENRPALWDEFQTIAAEPMPLGRPLNGMFDFDDFQNVLSMNHHFDWGAIEPAREQEMPDFKTAEAVCAFLEKPHSKPFFCATGFYKPHLPWYVPQRFLDLYPLDEVSLPFVKNDDLDDVPAIAKAWALSPPDHETILKHGQWRNAVQGYLAAISYCDSQIGRVLAALDASPAADNTIVVLWGDNGFHLGEKLHWRKFVLWEEATRVPFIMLPPRGMAISGRVEQPVSLVDLFPTLLDLCGLEPPADIDGRSLMPLVRGTKTEDHSAIMTWLRGNHSVRSGRWRYTRYSDLSEELYDLSADPYEWNNLIGDARFEHVRLDLGARLPSDRGD